jgi:hypothetical protein
MTEEQSNFVWLPSYKIAINIMNISSIRVYPPRELKVDFPELITTLPRRKESKWKCTIKLSGGDEIHISGEEAEAFLNLIKSNIRWLSVKNNLDEEEEN